MIAPFEDKVDGVEDRILPYGDSVLPLVDRVRAFGKPPAQGAPPRYAGPFLPAPPLKYGVVVQVQPAQPGIPAVQFSPNAVPVAAVQFNPNAPAAPAIQNTPAQPQVIGAITDPAAPGAVVVGRDPLPAQAPTVVHSPASPAIDSVQYQPNQPAVVSSGNDVLMPNVVTVEHSPNSATITQAEAYDYNSIHLGLWRYSQVQTDYISILVPFGFADDPNTGNYPDGSENEIVKIQEYLSSTGGAFDLVKTDDGLIGGTNNAQIFNLADRGVTWEYVEFANTPTAANYSLYRGVTRPPRDPSIVDVESDPDAVASVSIEHDPNQASVVDITHSPNAVASVTLDKSPDAVLAQGEVQDPGFALLQPALMPNSGHANNHTFAVRPRVIALQTDNKITSGNIYEIIRVNTSSGNTQLGEIGGGVVGWLTGRGTKWEVLKLVDQPYVQHDPNATSVPRIVHTPPLPVQAPVASIVTAPNQVGPVTVSTQPQAVGQVSVLKLLARPGVISVVHSPNAPSAVTMGVRPVAPQVPVVGKDPNPVATVSADHIPEAPQVVDVLVKPLGIGVVNVTHSPSAPQTIQVQSKPYAPSLVTTQASPAQVGTVTVGATPAAPRSITSIRMVGTPASISVEHDPNAAAITNLSVIQTSPQQPSVVSVGAQVLAPNAPTVSFTPNATQTPVVGKDPLATQVPTVQSTPGAPSTVSSGRDPKAPNLPLIQKGPNQVTNVTVTSNPYAPVITSIAVIQTSPSQVSTVTASAAGAPSATGAPTISHSPNAPQVPTAVQLGGQPVSPGVPVVSTDPNAPSTINTTIIGAAPNAPRTPIRVGTLPMHTATPSAGFTYDEPVRWQNKEYIRFGPELLKNGSFMVPPVRVGAEYVVTQQFQNANVTWFKDDLIEVWTYNPADDKYRFRLTSNHSQESSWRTAAQILAVARETIQYPDQWDFVNGAADLDQLHNGNLEGQNGAVTIKQMFDAPITEGTYTVDIQRPLGNIGNVNVSLLNSSGQQIGGLLWDGSAKTNHGCQSTASVEIPAGTFAYGFRISTVNGQNIVSGVSFFEGVKSGGVVITYAGGGLEKTSGSNAWDTGASSIQVIPGNRDGYVQFQIAQLGTGKDQNIGFTYLDKDYDVFDPYQMHVRSNGAVRPGNGSITSSGFVTSGDWMRIRHYSANNQIQYQKRQLVEKENPTVPVQVGQKIKILYNFTTGSGVEFKTSMNMITVSAISGTGQPQLFKAGTGESAYMSTVLPRGTYWEIIEDVEDYVTFYTDTNPTSGADLIIDTTFFHIGGRFNDVEIKTFL